MHRNNTSNPSDAIEQIGQFHETINDLLSGKDNLPDGVKRRIAKNVLSVIISDKSARNRQAVEDLIEKEINRLN